MMSFYLFTEVISNKNAQKTIKTLKNFCKLKLARNVFPNKSINQSMSQRRTLSSCHKYLKKVWIFSLCPFMLNTRVFVKLMFACFGFIRISPGGSFIFLSAVFLLLSAWNRRVDVGWAFFSQHFTDFCWLEAFFHVCHMWRIHISGHVFLRCFT